MFINPKDFKNIGLDKEIEKIIKQIDRIGRAYSNNTRLPCEIGKKYKDIYNYLDISTTNYRRHENKTIYLPKPNVIIIPQIFKNNIKYKLKIDKKLKL